MNELAPHSFIFEIPDAIPRNVCAEMVELFDACEDEQHEGVLGEDARVDRGVKRSTDLMVQKQPHWQAYDGHMFDSLAKAIRILRSKYLFWERLGNFRDAGYQLQKSGVGDFYSWHCDSDNLGMSNRFLAAIWYLNDDFTGGMTEFNMQGLAVKPEVGKLLLFPPWWTHSHRGQPVLSGNKYIATTWLRYAA